jgi:hypothetical protein
VVSTMHVGCAGEVVVAQTSKTRVCSMLGQLCVQIQVACWLLMFRTLLPKQGQTQHVLRCGTCCACVQSLCRDARPATPPYVAACMENQAHPSPTFLARSSFLESMASSGPSSIRAAAAKLPTVEAPTPVAREARTLAVPGRVPGLLLPAAVGPWLEGRAEGAADVLARTLPDVLLRMPGAAPPAAAGGTAPPAAFAIASIATFDNDLSRWCAMLLSS